MLKRVVTVALAIALMGLAGCAELRDLRKQNANLTDQLASLQSEKGQLLEENRVLQALRDSLQASLDKVTNEARQMAAVVDEFRLAKEEADRVALKLKETLRNIPGLTVGQGSEGNFVVMDSNVFFAPGSDELNADASASLDKLVEYFLLDYPEQKIRVDGHTDGVPITHSPWKDNYHLGAMRALAVMRYLTGKGLDPSRAYVASFGPNRPEIEPEEPTAEVAENRRVEILLVPKKARGFAEILENFGR